MNKFSRRNFLTLSSASLMAGMGGLHNFAYGQSLYNPNITQLIQFSRGNLPILIVAPHGGTELVTGIGARRNVNRPVANFSYYGAIWTREICIQIQKTLQQVSGGASPYMVVNLAHRRYLDVNREESDAYEVAFNSPKIYWEYHDMINEYVNRMNVLYKYPLLIEITGQGEFPNLIMRRTLNGATMQPLIQKTGKEDYNTKLIEFKNQWMKTRNTRAESQNKKKLITRITDKENIITQYGNTVFSGKKSLIAEIQKRGYHINPDLYETDTEQALTIAGNYTLELYGTRKVNNINSIQLVIGSDYRKTSNYLQTGRDLGLAIWDFAQTYISQDLNIS